jgi:hypothetical protein
MVDSSVSDLAWSPVWALASAALWSAFAFVPVPAAGVVLARRSAGGEQREGGAEEGKAEAAAERGRVRQVGHGRAVRP